MGYIPAGGGSVEDGQVINGVAHFVRPTVPFQRNDLSALVAGDRWYKPIDNGVVGTAGNWIWTGADWVSDTLLQASVGHTVTGSSTSTSNLAGTGANFLFPGTRKIFITHSEFAVRPVLTISSVNDFTARLTLYSNASGFYDLVAPFSCFSAGYTNSSTIYRRLDSHNTVLDFSTVPSNQSIPGLNINLIETGTAQASFYGSMYYRFVHP